MKDNKNKEKKYKTKAIKLPRNLTDRIGSLRCRACGKELGNSNDELCSICWGYANEYFNEIDQIESKDY